MDAERWKRIDELCRAALAQPVDRRGEFLGQACPDDPHLRAEVESVLLEGAGSFLESGAVPAIRTLNSGTKLGNFEILEMIGSGGMGEVYRAHDPRLQRDVAIKVLPAGVAHDADRIARFEREARAASALNHPNIVQVYDIGHDHETHWIATELITGESLAKMVEGGPVAARKAIEIGAQIADGLAAAHAVNIVHRDLKPANIMVARDGRVKIVDFGLAKQRRAATDSTNLTDERTVMGTAGYMSPERVRGEEADYRSDLFSFGVILYEMLGAKRAFGGGSAVEVMHAILKDEPPELPPSVPPALHRIVLRCIEKDPARRFQTAADLSFALQASQTSSAQTPPRRRAWPKWAIPAAALVALAAGGWFWLTRPLPPPRVAGMVQITHDNLPKRYTAITDGARLFLSPGTFRPAYQVSVNGGESIPLTLQTGNGVQLLDVAPDRSEFLVCKDTGGTHCELWAEPMVGGSARRLGNLESSPPPSGAWSPDAKQLVYVRDNELHLARSDGTEIRKLAEVAGRVYSPQWWPDGSRIRFVVDPPGKPERFWDVLPDGTGLRLVLPGWNPSWDMTNGRFAPDGRYFFFWARRGIWAVREKDGLFQRAGSEPVQLNTGFLRPDGPAPSADGKRLFFTGFVRRNELVRFDLNSNQFSLLLAGISGTELEFSRDGKWVAYATYPEQALFRSAPDGSQRVQLTSPPFEAGAPHWSPDGRQIAFLGWSDEKPVRMYVMPSEGGAPRQVSNGEGGKNGDRDPSWSPDGTSLAFGSGVDVNPDEEAIHIVDLKTNHVSVLPGSNGLFSPRWSPDGRFIACVTGRGWELVLYDMRTGRHTQLTSFRVGHPAWTQDGEWLFFGDFEQTLWRVRIRDKHLERLRSMKDMRIANWGWFGPAPKNSLITARNTGTEEVYALDLELP